jgi:hypothetical protein
MITKDRLTNKERTGTEWRKGKTKAITWGMVSPEEE